ncbi:serine/threonine-protein kinase meng-po isoform X2 [Diachasma alloeum]|uniref:serine/threonine-protein kinase meng-po isoform X2 n=1 Tax=Diachasma alloeum TaxID=454923 RepID=UPI00073810B2|nr:serine/threonine-protein kinase meng-po isoform X2 [Diachasma alloeum]XP_015110868.1 serine/threonine-protein kinase meng-po isoform X2 [Diachasma alloeum]
MSNLSKKSISGSIHRIREFELEKVNLAEEFDILQIVGEGWFGKILLTEHKSTQTEMVLKALPKAYTAITDFYREFHYGLHLSAHRNIITTYDVAFETAGFYVFSQEYAPLGDLTANVSETGLGELHAKRVARQLAAAIHHIHSRELVHRDIKLDNVLVFKSDFSRIKLCDFGETRKVNTIVRRHNEWLPYSPPEVLRVEPEENYKALIAHDVWQFGIVLFVCLTGCLPWQKAALDDRRYTRYLNWHSATLKIAKKPKLFQLISSRAQTMFSRLLEPKLEKRPVSVLEVNKYVDDRWLGKLGAEKALNGGADERDELCPSMYSFHSSLEEKNQLLYTLTRYGIETTVDRAKKKDRIREWIQASAIAEENEDDDSILEELEKLHENSEDDEANMKGRHFPERRPSVKSSTPDRPITSAQVKPKEKNGSLEKRHRKSKSTHRPSLKNIERRNPFAPQVAREMQTIARFSSFPNGDPNFGINTSHSLPSLPTGLKGEDLQPLRHSGPLGSIAPVQKAASVTQIVTNDDQQLDRTPSVSNRGTSASNSYDNIPTPINSTPESSRIEINGSKSPPQADEAVNNYHQNVPQSPLPPTRRNKGQSPAQAASQSPRMSPHVEKNIGGSKNTSNQALPMSLFAGQLVMQSFKTIQGVTQHASKPVASSYNKKESERNEGHGAVYGKDAYEHYGVAQGAIIRPQFSRNRGSPGSSRSVSN